MKWVFLIPLYKEDGITVIGTFEIYGEQSDIYN